MFICKECADKRGNWGITTSYGPCEDCGKTRWCYDIPSAALNPTKSESPPKDLLKKIIDDETP